MYPSFNARAVGLVLTGLETVELAADVGFEGADLLVRDILEAGESVAAIKAGMNRRGLRPGAFPLPMDWRGSRETFERDLAALPRHAETAAELGLSRTGTWVMPETPDREPGCVERAAELHRERLGAIAEVLRRFDVRLGLEAIGVASFRKGTGVPFVTRLDQLAERLGPIEAIGPNVGVLVDGFHLHAADEGLESLGAWTPGRLVWVHVADLPQGASTAREAILDHDRGLPGESGAVDGRGLLTKLRRLGYDGPVTVEPMPSCRSLINLSAGAKAEALLKSILRIWPYAEAASAT